LCFGAVGVSTVFAVAGDIFKVRDADVVAKEALEFVEDSDHKYPARPGLSLIKEMRSG
jgi:hypothetical protein